MEHPNRIRELRELAGKTLESLAAEADMSVSYLSRLETGERNLSLKTMGKIAAALRLRDPGDLVTTRTIDGNEMAKADEIERPKTDPAPLITAGGPNHQRGGALLPVYAATQGGQGHLIVTFDPVDYKSAPEEVMRAKDAHGILVVGDSMVPAYWPGDIVWVTPYKPLQRDKDYVLYHGKPAGEAECMIKRLVGFSDRELKLRQWNPLKDFTEAGRDWPVRHQIHSKTNA